MKKIIIVALSATILATGCQKTEVINPVGGPTMSFSTGMSKLTKGQGAADAAFKGQKNLEAQDFSVWAYADPDSDFSTSTVVDAEYIYDGIKNLLVECTTASADAVAGDGTDENPGTPAVSAEWSTAMEYYWPGENKDLRFFAVSADGDWLRPAAPAVCPVTIDYNAPSLTIDDFTVRAVKDGEKTAANEDLMVADFVKQNQSKKVVDLTFRHTLSKVEFVFKTLSATEGEAPTVYVQSLEVDGMQYMGDLAVTAKDAQAADIEWDFEWTNAAATTKFTDDWTATVTYPQDVEAAVAADDSAMELTTTPETFTTWLMLPQTISDQKVTIKYVINKRQFTAVFPLNGDQNVTISSWECNQHIKYTITLAPNVISFVPSVDGWDTATDVVHQN